MSSNRHLPDISGTWEFRRKNEIFTEQHPEEVGTLQVTQQGDRFTGIVDWGVNHGKWKLVDGIIQESRLSFGLDGDVPGLDPAWGGTLDASGNRIVGDRMGHPPAWVWFAERK